MKKVAALLIHAYPHLSHHTEISRVPDSGTLKVTTQQNNKLLFYSHSVDPTNQNVKKYNKIELMEIYLALTTLD